MTADRTPPAAGPVRRFPILTPPSRAAVVAAIGVAVVMVLIFLVGETLATFVIGLILILVLDPLVTWLTKRGLPRWVATILGIGLLAVILLTFGYIVITTILKQGPSFLHAIDDSLVAMQQWVNASNLPAPIRDSLASFLAHLEAALISLDVAAILQAFLASVSGLIGPLVTMVLILPFFMFYVLSDLPHLAAAGRRSIPVQWRSDVLHVADISVGSFTTYIRAEALLMVVLGTITFVGLMVLSFVVDPGIGQYALFLALIAAFSELIPTFGPYIALVPAVIFTASLGIGPLVAVVLLYIVIMFLEGNVLVPRIEGGKFELHPAFVIVLVLGGLALIGPLGAILAMPVTAAGRDVFRYAFARASGMPQPLVDDQGRILEPDSATAPVPPSTGSAAGA